MKKFVLVLLLCFLAFSVSAEEVIVVLEGDASLGEVLDVEGLEPKLKLETGNAITATVDSGAIEELEKLSDVVSVEKDLVIKAFVEDSLPLMNVDDVLSYQINSVNISGLGSACIIDTGMAYDIEPFNCTTDSFLAGTCEKIIGGVNYVNESLPPYDDHGHGTHVTGITYHVAPNAKFVEVKILNDVGTGQISDLADALTFCYNNRDVFNISVVSMSLGTEPLFTSECDGSSVFLETMAGIVDDLTAENITVLASSGNNGNRTHIPAPACFSNVIAVGASDDSDGIWSGSNVNSLVEFVAPGVGINSYSKGGSMIENTGTSMATPHIAGAVLLLQHYSDLGFESEFLVSEIKSRLFNNAVTISEFGFDFRRPNVFEALELPLGFGVSIDYPLNETYNFTNFDLNYTTSGDVGSCWMELNSETLDCGEFNATEGSNNLEVFVNHTDGRTNSSSVIFSVDVTEPTLVINSPLSGSLVSSDSVNLSVSTGAVTCSYNVGDGAVSFDCIETSFVPSYGEHDLIVSVIDSAGNSKSGNLSFSFVPELPVVTSLNPEENLKTTLSEIGFECRVVGEDIKEVRLYDDLSGTYELDESSSVSGISVDHTFTVSSIDDGVYNWACAGLDVDDELIFSDNRTLTVDGSVPVITLISPEDDSNFTSNPVVFEYNVTDLTTISKCELYVGDSKTRESTDVLKGIKQSFSDSLSNGEQRYFVSCTDTLWNNANSSVRSFSVDVPEEVASTGSTTSGGGGGGGGGSSRSVGPEEEIAIHEGVDVDEDTNLETKDEDTEDSDVASEGNLITGLVTSEFTEKIKGGAKVLGYIVLGVLGLGVLIFGFARIFHHDWESDDVGMRMQAKLFVEDKYHWVKNKLARKGPFDDVDEKPFDKS